MAVGVWGTTKTDAKMVNDLVLSLGAATHVDPFRHMKKNKKLVYTFFNQSITCYFLFRALQLFHPIFLGHYQHHRHHRHQ